MLESTTRCIEILISWTLRIISNCNHCHPLQQHYKIWISINLRFMLILHNGGLTWGCSWSLYLFFFVSVIFPSKYHVCLLILTSINCLTQYSFNVLCGFGSTKCMRSQSHCQQDDAPQLVCVGIIFVTHSKDILTSAKILLIILKF